MACRLSDMLRRYRRNEQGVISVMAAGALVLALAVAMIVIDSGSMLYARRSLQAVTDAAALGAVRQIGDADAAEAASSAIFAMNGYSYGGDDMTVPGVYKADPAERPEHRFTPEGGGVEPTDINAVRVTKYAQSPTYFARLFGFGDVTAISAISTAAYTRTASFSAGTRLADVNLGRQIFSGLLGIDVGVLNYEELASVNVDAVPFLDALATVKGLDAGTDTYGDLLEMDVTLGDLAYAFDCAGAGCARTVFENLSTGGTSVPLNKILNATPLNDRKIGSISPNLNQRQTFNVLDLLAGSAMAMGEGQVVEINLAGGRSPLVSVSGSVTVGSAMAHMAIGKVGDSVHTSQVDVQLEAIIGVSIPPIVNTAISLPIFVRAGAGTAKIASIPCNPDGTMVNLSGTTEAGIVRIGTGIDGPQPTLSLTVLSGLIHVPVSASVSGTIPVAAGGPSEVSFSESEYDEAKSMSSDTALSTLDVIVGGGPLVPRTQLSSAISGVLGSLNMVVDSILTTLGVKLGSMDMIVHGARCNAPVLVS